MTRRQIEKGCEAFHRSRKRSGNRTTVSIATTFLGVGGTAGAVAVATMVLLRWCAFAKPSRNAPAQQELVQPWVRVRVRVFFLIRIVVCDYESIFSEFLVNRSSTKNQEEQRRSAAVHLAFHGNLSK